MRLFFIFLLALMATCNNDSPTASGRPEEDIDGNIAFIHVNVVSMENENVMMDQTVLISNGIIERISGNESPPQDYFIIDGSNQYLMPGLADIHTHVNYEEDLLPYVANGITTILNMGSPGSILEFRAKAARKEMISPTIFASAFVDGVGNRGWVIRTPEEAVGDIAQIKSQGWDFIKVYNGIKTDVFLSIQTEAAKNNIAIIGHGVREPGMEFILSHGQVMVAHMEEYLYTHFNNMLDESLVASAIKITKDNGTFVTPNLSAYEAIASQWGNPSGLAKLLQQDGIKYVSPKWKEFWNGINYTSNGGSIEPQYNFLKDLTKKFDDANIPLLLGTDSPYIPGLPVGYSIHDDLRNLVGAGLSPFNSIKAGTRTAGEFINHFVTGAQSFGLVKEGYRADLILLEANPLDNVTNIKKRVGVMANGRWMSEKYLQKKLSGLTN